MEEKNSEKLFSDKEIKPKKKLSFFLFLGILVFSALVWLSQQAKFNISVFEPQIYEFGLNKKEIETMSKWQVKNTEDVLQIVENQVADKQGQYGWYVVSLKDGKNYGQFYDQAYTAASVNKLPLLVKFLLDVEQGKQDLSNTYRLKSKDIEEGTGYLQYESVGSQHTLEELITMIGKHSDNTATNAIMELVTRERLQDFVNGRDMKNTNIKNNTSSPKDMVELLVDLYLGKIFKNDKYKNLTFSVLTDTEFEDRISKGVPESVQVIHKIGNGIQVWNDAGLVLGENPYALVIMTKESKESEAQEILPIISEIVWTYENQKQL